MKTTYIVRWIIGVILGAMTLANGFHWSSIFMILSIILILPIKPIKEFLCKYKIKNWLAIALSVIFLFFGALNSKIDISTNDYDGYYDYNIVGSSEYVNTYSKPENDSSEKVVTDEPKSESKTSYSSNNVDEESSETSSSSSTDSLGILENSTPNNNQKILVWIPTNGGKKYHSKSTCSQMKNPIQITEQEAINRNFTPCARCY